MKSLSTYMVALCALVCFTNCGEDDEDGGDTDLTTNAVGVFTEVSGNAVITVNKVDNNTVSIIVDDSNWDFAFTDVTMNSATAFTLNTYTRNGDGCDGTETISGTGTASNNNISLFIAIDAVGGTGFAGPCNDDTYNVSASK